MVNDGDFNMAPHTPRSLLLVATSQTHTLSPLWQIPQHGAHSLQMLTIYK